jgi:excisionase family DNA binding protein
MVRVNKTNSMLTTRDVARMFNVHINTVRRWSNLGVLEPYRFGPRGDRRFSKEDIANFLANSQAAVQGENGNGSRR